MKSIQKIIILGLIALLTANVATAQRGERGKTKDPVAYAQKQTERLAEKLSLTEAQVAQVSKINLAHAEKVKTAKANGTDRSAMKSLHTEQKAAIKAVLTSEQLAKYESMKERKGGKKGGKKGKGKRGDKAFSKDPQAQAQRHTEHLTKKLSLTESQATQINQINLAYTEKMNAARTNAADKAAAKASMKALKAEQKTAIKAILTPEQITKYDEMKDGRGKGKHKGGKKGK